MINYLKNRVIDYVNSDTDECILFPILDRDGYGSIQYSVKGKHGHCKAHRLVYKIVNNCTLTKNDVIMHSCDTPACCNPKHLSKGSHVDNVRDRQLKNRQAKGSKNGRYIHGHYSVYEPIEKEKPLFENLYSRSLPKDEVVKIKKAILNKGNRKLIEIANDFNVKYQTIRDINCGKTYRNVTI